MQVCYVGALVFPKSGSDIHHLCDGFHIEPFSKILGEQTNGVASEFLYKLWLLVQPAVCLHSDLFPVPCTGRLVCATRWR